MRRLDRVRARLLAVSCALLVSATAAAEDAEADTATVSLELGPGSVQLGGRF